MTSWTRSGLAGPGRVASKLDSWVKMSFCFVHHVSAIHVDLAVALQKSDACHPEKLRPCLASLGFGGNPKLSANFYQSLWYRAPRTNGRSVQLCVELHYHLCYFASRLCRVSGLNTMRLWIIKISKDYRFSLVFSALNISETLARFLSFVVRIFKEISHIANQCCSIMFWGAFLPKAFLSGEFVRYGEFVTNGL